jgi:hypothetical protein
VRAILGVRRFLGGRFGQLEIPVRFLGKLSRNQLKYNLFFRRISCRKVEN